MKTPLILAAAASLSSAVFTLSPAFAQAPAPAPAAKPAAFDIKLEAGAVHEECVSLAAGASKRHSWSSNVPVDFNIHYHVGEAVLYPLRRDGVVADSGTFTAKIKQDYCWMWTAKAPARLRGKIE